MQLVSRGVAVSVEDALDYGLKRLQFVETGTGLSLITSSGRNGGLSSYRLNGSDWSLKDQTFFTGAAAQGRLDMLGLVQGASGPILAIAADSGGMAGILLTAGGSFAGIAQVQAAEAGGLIQNFAIDSDTLSLLHRAGFCDALMPDALGAGYGQILASATVGGRQFMILADQFSHDLSAILMGSGMEAGAVAGHLAARMGAAQGLGIAAPTAIQTVQMDGKCFVVLAAAGSGSLSVMELTGAGNLVLTEHLIDTLETRFAAVQALATAQVGDQVLVLAGGGDHGLTLFSLLPNGQLVWRATLADTLETSLHNVAALAMHVMDGTLHIAAGSQRDRGASLFTLDVSNLGETWRNDSGRTQNHAGTAGGDILMAQEEGDILRGLGGDDVLVAGPGRTVMVGGNGADIFVMKEGTSNVKITDFEKGVDRLDLSDWPMLRDPGALTISSTSTGAHIDYRGHRLEIQSHDQNRLSATDLFGPRFAWADRVIVSVDIAEHDSDPGLVLRADHTGQTLTGGAWDDRINGGNGDDRLIGAGGDDRLIGGRGDDSLYGGDGDDALYGLDGDDYLHGDDGNDYISAGDGDDTVSAGPGHDTVYGGEGNDRLIGGSGNDSMRGSNGNDTLYGLNGNDMLRGDGGNDYISAGNGDDTVSAGPGHDTVYGGEGNDRLIGGSGNDSMRGSNGNDTLYGLNGNDMLRGDGGNDYISAGDGDDTVSAGPGHDTVYGGDGNDRLIGGSGNDSMRGGNGNDTLYGLNGNDMLRGDGGNDYISAGDGDDTVSAGPGHDTVYGGDGNDRLIGGSGNDSMRGSNGNDTLYGLNGNDMLEGDTGDDYLSGGAGDDTLIGGAGQDTLLGGEGADEFIWEDAADSPAGAADVIIGFEPGEDVIDLSLWQRDLSWADSFDGRAGRIVYDDATGHLGIDLDGSGHADFGIDLIGSPALTEADLLF